MPDQATSPLTRKDIEAKIVALAWQDNDFRREFVTDPKRQFEERLSIKLPPSLKITVHEENENSLHFVIPAKPRADATELSDEDLEKVAGGTDVAMTIAMTVATIGIGASIAVANDAW